MIPNDRKKFVEVVIGFAELKGKQLSAPALELYWRSLQHWSLEDFIAAAEQLIRTSEFMPTPKDFEDLRKAARPTSGEAWILACETARNWRELRQNVSSGDPFVDRVARAVGGYRAIAMHDSDKLHFLEKRFAEHFETMQEAGDTRDALPELMLGLTGPPANGPRRLLGGN
jgi:hypothetical protein